MLAIQLQVTNRLKSARDLQCTRTLGNFSPPFIPEKMP